MFKNSFEGSQEEELKYAFPAGYMINQDFRKFQIGNFIKMTQGTPLRSASSSNLNLVNKVAQLNQLESKSFLIFQDPKNIQQVFTFKSLSMQGDSLINIIVSLSDRNILYQGGFDDAGSIKELKSIEFKDFRTVVGVASLENGAAFLQIEDLSYIVDLKTLHNN